MNIPNQELIQKLKPDYELKKEKIISRLQEFQDFYSKPLSWFYHDNEMKLHPVETDDNHRLFEELSFCIFTANTSAEMGLKAVDATRHVLMNGTAEEMTRRLDGIYRFNNVRPQYIIHTRKYLQNTINFELKKKIKSFDDNDKLRDFFALNKDVKGLGFKEASHFLRNIGFRGYAILDKHIINSLFEYGVINNNEKPKNKKQYLEIEEKFKQFSESVGIDMDELDLLLWSRKNGRILK